MNPADIAILQHYADRGERLAYWKYLDAVSLRETGRHSSYAVLAARLVQNQMADRALAERCAAECAEMQTAMEPYDWEVLGLQLVIQDLKFRRDCFDRERMGSDAVPGCEPPSEAPTHPNRIGDVLQAMSGRVSVSQDGGLLFAPGEACSGAMGFTFKSYRSDPSANDARWGLRP